ncbi:MAG: 50S ribosomal protein L10 [Candidatus Diapherotrites archaeon]|nr:50S ribosomal protein L10 [Candidatus Diapherotrites archaeon]
MAHVAEWKKKAVKELEELIQKYPVIAISSIKGLPASQFQEIRAKLREKAVIKVVKLNLLRIAMENSGKEEVKQLEKYLDGPIAVIFTEMDAFRLFKTLKKNRSKAAAKAGQIAPFDIIVPAGDTGLPPGPALGDLKAAGINARIDGGSIKVMKDSVVAKEGDIITPEVANALNKLGVKPFEIGLDVNAVLDAGVIFTPQVLDISEEETIQNIQNAYMNALNLSVNCAYPTHTSIPHLIAKAFKDALNLGINAVILDKRVIEELLTKAQAQASVLASHIKEN